MTTLVVKKPAEPLKMVKIIPPTVAKKAFFGVVSPPGRTENLIIGVVPP